MGLKTRTSGFPEATCVAEKLEDSAPWSASDKFPILDDDDAVAGSPPTDDGLLRRGYLLSGVGPTNEDDAVAALALHDRDSRVEKRQRYIREYREPAHSQDAIVCRLTNLCEALDGSVGVGFLSGLASDIKSMVWYFRGTPHVRIWINVADDPSVKIVTSGCNRFADSLGTPAADHFPPLEPQARR
jgi:hypothetical protein